MPKHPWFKLFAADWNGSQRLKFCSAASHGLLINLLCLAHDSDPYGHIVLKEKFAAAGVPVTVGFGEQLSRVLPFSAADIAVWLDELVEEGIVSFDSAQDDKRFNASLGSAVDDGDGKYEGVSMVFGKLIHEHELSLKRARVGRKGGTAGKLPRRPATVPQTGNADPSAAPPAPAAQQEMPTEGLPYYGKVYPLPEFVNSLHNEKAWRRWLAAREQKWDDTLTVVQQEEALMAFGKFCNLKKLDELATMEFFAHTLSLVTAEGWKNLRPDIAFERWDAKPQLAVLGKTKQRLRA